jgi:hypothetical protein
MLSIDKNSHRARAAVAALAFTLTMAMAGCVTIGRPFDRDRVPAIVLEKTTRSDVTGMFGRPFRTGLEDGDVTWTYLHYRLGLFSGQTTSDLYIRFNPNGTVKSYSYNTNE